MMLQPALPGLWRRSLCFLGLGLAGAASVDADSGDFRAWAPQPPLGWNSWDYYGTTINEGQALAQAEAMARDLRPHGWSIFVVDIQWYGAGSKGFDYVKDLQVSMDGYGRLLPNPERFPSSREGRGFGPLAAYVHSLGLKFGVHLMRGIPKAAVRQHARILGTSLHAADIADLSDTCSWNTDMAGVAMDRPGAQAYYDSVFSLLASWGVDFVKVDDSSRPYHAAEIRAIRKAIDRSGRPILLSLSPGATPLERGSEVASRANLWRISDDFWDSWKALKEQFGRLDRWTPYRGPGHYPDPDMIPLGLIRMGKPTRFTPDEQRTLMTLWAISGSPLIFGGDMTRMDPLTLGLLTNDAVLAIDQAGRGQHQAWSEAGIVVWQAYSADSAACSVALFNTSDLPREVEVDRHRLGVAPTAGCRDVWTGQPVTGKVRLGAHACALLSFLP